MKENALNLNFYVNEIFFHSNCTFLIVIDSSNFSVKSYKNLGQIFRTEIWSQSLENSHIERANFHSLFFFFPLKFPRKA